MKLILFSVFKLPVSLVLKYNNCINYEIIVKIKLVKEIFLCTSLSILVIHITCAEIKNTNEKEFNVCTCTRYTLP